MDLDRAGLRMKLFRVQIRRAVTTVSVSLATIIPLTKSVKVTTDMLSCSHCCHLRAAYFVYSVNFYNMSVTFVFLVRKLSTRCVFGEDLNRNFSVNNMRFLSRTLNQRSKAIARCNRF